MNKNCKNDGDVSLLGNSSKNLESDSCSKTHAQTNDVNASSTSDFVSSSETDVSSCIDYEHMVDFEFTDVSDFYSDFTVASCASILAALFSNEPAYSCFEQLIKEFGDKTVASCSDDIAAFFLNRPRLKYV